jgi:hypothetical protein
MAAEPGDRLFAGLPAVFRSRDGSEHLARLLGVFEALLFERPDDGEAKSPDDNKAGLPGIERQLPLIPALFAPTGTSCNGAPAQTPDTFVRWLAAALAFTPHAVFEIPALRRIIAGIVPLYGLRGTRSYLLKLLHLCFEGEVLEIQVDDRPRVGFTIGKSMVGIDTRFGSRRPFWFKVVVQLHQPASSHPAASPIATLEKRLRTVIDFAKPAHTAYELDLHAKPQPPPAASEPPIADERDG